MSDDNEMLTGVKILLDRMEMFPEEFVSKDYDGRHKWADLLDHGWRGILTDEEKTLLSETLKKAQRTVFSQRVAAHVLYLENEAITFHPNSVKITAGGIANTGGSGGVKISSTSGSGGGGSGGVRISTSLTGTHSVRDHTGYIVVMHEHEFKYYSKQDPARQKSYLEWIKNGRR